MPRKNRRPQSNHGVDGFDARSSTSSDDVTIGGCMRYAVLPLMFAFFMLTACAGQETMAKNARISMQEAVRTAEASVPGGKAKETHLETEGGRTVYEVEM